MANGHDGGGTGEGATLVSHDGGRGILRGTMIGRNEGGKGNRMVLMWGRVSHDWCVCVYHGHCCRVLVNFWVKKVGLKIIVSAFCF